MNINPLKKSENIIIPSIKSKILDILEIYNSIDNITDECIYNEPKYSYNHQTLINNISEHIINDNLTLLYKYYNKIQLLISNCLIKQILENSPKVDIILLKFPNIKTELYPYQINNLNWMYNIEKHKYSNEFDEI
jgi:hypothetical protein